MSRKYKEYNNKIVLDNMLFKTASRVAICTFILFIILLVTWLVTEPFSIDEFLVFLFLIWIPYNFIKVSKICVISNAGIEFAEKKPWQEKSDFNCSLEIFKYIVMSRSNAGSVGGDSGGHNFHLYLSPDKSRGPYDQRILSFLPYYGSKDPKDVVTLARKINKLTGQPIIVDKDFSYAYQEYFPEGVDGE